MFLQSNKRNQNKQGIESNIVGMGIIVTLMQGCSVVDDGDKGSCQQDCEIQKTITYQENKKLDLVKKTLKTDLDGFFEVDELAAIPEGLEFKITKTTNLESVLKEASLDDEFYSLVVRTIQKSLKQSSGDDFEVKIVIVDDRIASIKATRVLRYEQNRNFDLI
jgi:hypothetical protein